MHTSSMFSFLSTPPSPFLVRKSHQRALESLQASLDAEVRGKADGLKLKKKLEADINELELQVDLLTKNNAELSKNSKKMQQQIKVFLFDFFFFISLFF